MRGFVELAEGQLHLRDAGRGSVPLVMLHKSPFASASLLPLIEALAPSRRVIAPDMPGSGQSCAMPQPEPTIADYAEVTLRLLDALGIAQADLYGAHSGARIAVALALSHPDRVRRLVLDGFGLRVTTDEAAIARHAPVITLDTQGQALMWLWHFVRDQHLFAPWHARDAAHGRPRGLPDAATLHARFLEAAQAATTYHHLYRAALRYPMAEHLPRVTQNMVLLFARDDSVFDQLRAARALLPHAQAHATDGHETPQAAQATAALIKAFLT
jgi:pimeloyl-ACP methyl ester carboxylesterase